MKQEDIHTTQRRNNKTIGIGISFEARSFFFVFFFLFHSHRTHCPHHTSKPAHLHGTAEQKREGEKVRGKRGAAKMSSWAARFNHIRVWFYIGLCVRCGRKRRVSFFFSIYLVFFFFHSETDCHLRRWQPRDDSADQNETSWIEFVYTRCYTSVNEFHERISTGTYIANVWLALQAGHQHSSIRNYITFLWASTETNEQMNEAKVKIKTENRDAAMRYVLEMRWDEDVFEFEFVVKRVMRSERTFDVMMGNAHWFRCAICKSI